MSFKKVSDKNVHFCVTKVSVHGVLSKTKPTVKVAASKSSKPDIESGLKPYFGFQIRIKSRFRFQIRKQTEFRMSNQDFIRFWFKPGVHNILRSTEPF